MPSANDFDPHFDNTDEQPPVVAAQPAAETEDLWAVSKSPPKTTGKKKKGKKHAAAKQKIIEDGEDSSPYPTSITPSPPNTDHGMKLQATSTLHPTPMPEQPSALPVFEDLPLVDLDDDPPGEQEVAIIPEPRAPSTPPPSVSPIVRSPRPAPARPVPPETPPSRPVSLHGASKRDRKNSLAGYRSPVISTQQTHPRRESLGVPRSRFVDPPPPHLPQAHYFGLPDLGIMNFGQKQEAGKAAGSDRHCCKLDTFTDAGDELSARKSRDAILVGCEGGLDVFRILPNKLEIVGRLEGLRGAVIGAKILPHTDRTDGIQILRPLIAVVIHGRMLDDRRDPSPEGEGADVHETATPTHFQTSVDVYSLQTQVYVATLYSSPPMAIEQPVVGQVSSLPDPHGDLEIDAKGHFITVSSGKSGEVFIYTQGSVGGVDDTRFRCIGKFWTSIQKSMSTPPARPANADANTSVEVKEEARKPLYSLSRRWLAIVPQTSTSSISIQGVATTSRVNRQPPGITTHAAPPPSLVSCEVVGTDVEGTWSRLGRQAAQGLVKYSQRGFEMGLQGWKELTQPSPPGGRQAHNRSSSKDDLFPPTKAPIDDPTRLVKEPALVSIIDLESLLMYEEHRPKHISPPMATFALVEGCNYLSLSSVGTRLLTASRKGEISTIWDLAQVAHGVPLTDNASDDESSTSPCVKQVLRIARNSPSTILDCAWSMDDDALAVFTAHGTVHLHEVPRRPTRKRKRASAPVVEKADATVSVSAGMSPPSANQGFLGSIKSSWQTVSTQVHSIRTSNASSTLGLPTTFAGFRETAAAGGSAASRAVARGLSQGYTAAKGGASDYWHADDNKIRHAKELQEPFSDKSMRWIRRNNTTSVAVACGGSVHIHPVQRVTRRKGDAIVSGLKHERYARKAFPLPYITTRSEAGGLQSLRANPCTDQGPHGFWSLRSSISPPHTGRKSSLQTGQFPRSKANDVETNPPYCPYHIDSRVSIYAFTEQGSQYGPFETLDGFQARGHGLPDEDSWTFGGALAASAKINERMPDEMHDSSPEDGYDDDDEDEDVAQIMESKLTIQPAHKSQGGEQIQINTRRRTRGKGMGKEPPATMADGDFELLEDDDGVF
ncbi:hypothetical protein CLAFUW4_01739 [Fulvia fulva]|uniref:Uncharacterized protein n=1 Tax=Passalora fulva TaxID=5499 RepID=A0A9Q8L792_PASFU|nr:uncharacterized protein CLAFUR5_01735 [Fulvia fulva]KAK4636224.1 hypothetical protein CLAFUR4_01737 [Fulvia fulva]KAK4637769.1 hypothetical protein CLAFUR0_01738 [Fulvia fulva]UJO12102.1 hypothetical protein CLAFUR5_01735 [Fulvia fulva]WPV09740.1 hypothetical protein CLAFUW4_01739 [Fulvia fulva]WPV24364.1 hypothetical protein CLAFUW7_01741 [Fulvia fulva]